LRRIVLGEEPGPQDSRLQLTGCAWRGSDKSAALTLVLLILFLRQPILSGKRVHEMSPSQKSPIPAEKITQYEKLLAAIPEVQRKGADNPYTAVNGNMFSLLLGPEGRLALRLSAGEREKFLKKYKTTLFEAYGAVMKEYVAVPDAMLQKTKEMQKYFALSYAYARTLKANPQKRKDDADLGRIPKPRTALAFTSIPRRQHNFGW
jgi:TfoX/Sxy family transcriptional regulator of competence genes